MHLLFTNEFDKVICIRVKGTMLTSDGNPLVPKFSMVTKNKKRVGMDFSYQKHLEV